ncbi:MAG TPA: signal peptidase I [Candidatus Limnocylindrales bacterium]|nr:signal peptidase I [Candidatus Limnocylindrales bacterium]
MFSNAYTPSKFSKVLLVALIAVMLLIAGLLLVLRSGQREVYSVQSTSMAPTINRGDAVVLSRSFSNLKRGDIITYRSSDTPQVFITHRIISVDRERNQVTAQGDGSAYADRPIASSQVVGQVTQTLPFFGYVLDAFRHPLGLVLGLYIPAAIIVADEFRRLARYYATRHYVLHNYLHHVRRRSQRA